PADLPGGGDPGHAMPADVPGGQAGLRAEVGGWLWPVGPASRRSEQKRPAGRRSHRPTGPIQLVGRGGGSPPSMAFKGGETPPLPEIGRRRHSFSSRAKTFVNSAGPPWPNREIGPLVVPPRTCQSVTTGSPFRCTVNRPPFSVTRKRFHFPSSFAA